MVLYVEYLRWYPSISRTLSFSSSLITTSLRRTGLTHNTLDNYQRIQHLTLLCPSQERYPKFSVDSPSRKGCDETDESCDLPIECPFEPWMPFERW